MPGDHCRLPRLCSLRVVAWYCLTNWCSDEQFVRQQTTMSVRRMAGLSIIVHIQVVDLISSTIVYGNSFLVTFLSLSAHKLLLRPRLDLKYLSS